MTSRVRSPFPLLSCLFLTLAASPANALEPIPDRLVVLTFDDSVKSHYTVARVVLKEYGFGATFFITEGFTFQTNKNDYMTWEEIRQLHDDGFEIGNHTRDHMVVTPKTASRLDEQLSAMDEQCLKMGIPKPTSFAWPGNEFAFEGLPVLRHHGILFARRGGMPEYTREDGRGPAYEPGRDDPHLIPSAGVPRPGWTLQTFIEAAGKAKDGRIAVIQFHGVPEGEHPWVHTTRELFLEYMKYLYDHDYKVIALRDLARYVDPKRLPDDPMAVIQQRLRTEPRP
jgi:peptidoglycan/xylan/chitin deacetylase (PgdA/CDA1 family)